MNHGKVSKEIGAGLVALKKRIAAAKIPSSKIDETLNIASWNIREFGKVRRTDAAIHYIAEILGQFDLIGMVELRDDLTDFLFRDKCVLKPQRFTRTHRQEERISLPDQFLRPRLVQDDPAVGQARGGEGQP